MLFVLSTWELFKPVENFYKSLFEQKEKGLVDMDNSVVIAAGRGE